MNDQSKTTPVYTVVPYYGPSTVQAGWCVNGPGIGGWQGIIPRTHDGMTKQAAEELAGLLNSAFALGQADRSRAIGRLIGG
jgi:hypothetical protein